MKKMCLDAGQGLISWISISEDYLRLSEDGIQWLPMVCQLVQWYTVHQRIGADALVKWEGGLKRGYFLMEGRLSPSPATGGAGSLYTQEFLVTQLIHLMDQKGLRSLRFPLYQCFFKQQAALGSSLSNPELSERVSESKKHDEKYWFLPQLLVSKWHKPLPNN